MGTVVGFWSPDGGKLDDVRIVDPNSRRYLLLYLQQGSVRNVRTRVGSLARRMMNGSVKHGSFSLLRRSCHADNIERPCVWNVWLALVATDGLLR